MTSVFDADSYTAPLSHIISEDIREYDISKANINILFYKGLISRGDYNYYYSLPKEQRAIKIGLLQRDYPNINAGLTQGFYEVRKMFYEANKVNEYEILSVKKDAIFLLNRTAQITKFDNIEFVEKNQYTSFYKLPQLELYYYYNSMSGVENIDIKGMSDVSKELHKPYMLELLMYIFNMAETGNSQEIVSSLTEIRSRYISGELGIGYFREFNNRSLFRSKIIINGERMYLSCLPKNTMAKDIDASYNYNILQELFKIYMTNYMRVATK